jgi:hypothetical protein
MLAFPLVSCDASVDDECQQTPRMPGRTKSGIELENRLDQRAQELRELLLLGQITLEHNQKRVRDIADDSSQSPTKRRRYGKERKLRVTFAKEEQVSVENQESAVSAEVDPTRSFWPEVSQLKKDMKELREKLREAKTERCKTVEGIRELQADLTKSEAWTRTLKALKKGVDSEVAKPEVAEAE